MCGAQTLRGAIPAEPPDVSMAEDVALIHPGMSFEWCRTLAAQGSTDDALLDSLHQEYRDLLEAYDRGGLPFERVLTRLGYARLLLAQRDPEQARAVIAVSLDLCRRLGCKLPP